MFTEWAQRNKQCTVLPCIESFKSSIVQKNCYLGLLAGVKDGLQWTAYVQSCPGEIQSETIISLHSTKTLKAQQVELWV